ncbi:hypothetical protein GCM10023238_24900 [Streptomyces heliomycini]
MTICGGRGIHTVDELAEAGEDELVRLLGKAHGHALFAMALARDERPVVAEREAKSVSVEDTYDVDIHDRTRARYGGAAARGAVCVRRLRAAGLSGRTIVLKVRRYDFSTLTRSETLRGPHGRSGGGAGRRHARLLDSVDTTGGVRLLGVGVSGLADYTQEDLFAQAGGHADDLPHEEAETASAPEPETPAERRWSAGQDVRHTVHGHGWVQGSGLGRVTVRFETPVSEPGRVKTFRSTTRLWNRPEPLPLVPLRPGEDEGAGAGGGSVGGADQAGLSFPASLPKSRSGRGGGAARSRP